MDTKRTMAGHQLRDKSGNRKVQQHHIKTKPGALLYIKSFGKSGNDQVTLVD